MSGSVNKIILVGNVGKDPEIRHFENGGKIASFSLATNETWKDRDTGERKERTQWHQISVLNGALAEICENHVRKGAKVYLEGQYESRKWTDKQNVERVAFEVVLRPFRSELILLDKADRVPPADTVERIPDEPKYKTPPAGPSLVK